MQKYGQEDENHLKVGSQKSNEKYGKIVKKYGLGGRKWIKKLVSEPSWSHLGPTEASNIENVAKSLIFDPPGPPRLEAKIQQKSLKLQT